MRRKIIATVGLCAAVVAVAGCDSYNNARGVGDAPVGRVADVAWDVENAPDGFGNVITRCSKWAPGWRIFQVTHGKTDVQPVVVRDETCKGG